jgi:hypothetical protein
MAGKLRSQLHYQSELAPSRTGQIPALAFIASAEQAMRKVRVWLVEREETSASLTGEARTRARGMNSMIETDNCRTQRNLLNWPPT